MERVAVRGLRGNDIHTRPFHTCVTTDTAMAPRAVPAVEQLKKRNGTLKRLH